MGPMDSETLIVDTPAEPHRPRPGIGIKDVLCVGPIIANSHLLLRRAAADATAARAQPCAAQRASRQHRLHGGRRRLREGREGPTPPGADRAAPDLDDDRPILLLGREDDIGRSLINYLSASDPRWRKRAARGERFFKKYGVWTIVLAPFLPAPSPLFYMAAGEAGMPFLIFIAGRRDRHAGLHRADRRRGLGHRPAGRGRRADDQQLRSLGHRRDGGAHRRVVDVVRIARIPRRRQALS